MSEIINLLDGLILEYGILIALFTMYVIIRLLSAFTDSQSEPTSTGALANSFLAVSKNADNAQSKLVAHLEKQVNQLQKDVIELSDKTQQIPKMRIDIWELKSKLSTKNNEITLLKSRLTDCRERVEILKSKESSSKDMAAKIARLEKIINRLNKQIEDKNNV